MHINGSQFNLRTWQITDAASLQKHANNVNISKYLFDRFPFPYQLSDAEKFISSKLGQHPVVNFAIEVNGEVAGGIGLEFRQDVYRKTPLLGYWLSEQYCYHRLFIIYALAYAFFAVAISSLTSGAFA